MPSKQLILFLFMSLLLHAALLALAAYIGPVDTVTKPKPIKVGILTKYKNPGEGKGKSQRLPPKGEEKPKTQSVKKEAPKPKQKKVSKTVPEKKTVKPSTDVKKREKPEKKEIANQPDKPSTEEPREIGGNEETGLISSGVKFGTQSSQGVGDRGKGLAQEGTGKGTEVGYPNYRLNPKPKYPMIARRNGYEGVVLLKVYVLENGKVGKLQLEKSSGYEMLDESAKKAVKDWEFIPGKRNGEPVPSWVTVPIRFQLSSG